MDIKATVKSIESLSEYFFIVPDYQREYVWKTEHVSRFLIDIETEFETNLTNQNNPNSYFIGSIIIVKNDKNKYDKNKYDVIDGQQRLTTIVISLCALRNILIPILDSNQVQDSKIKYHLDNIETWLKKFDSNSEQIYSRLELQYPESNGYLESLIKSEEYKREQTGSVRNMENAYQYIKEHFLGYFEAGLPTLIKFISYFLNHIELVVIKSDDLGSALKIFETINQRGVGLNAMDLVKNLLFSKANESDFGNIKETWKEIIQSLKNCGEDQKPLRFLRYFMMSRYHRNVLREDEVYNWIITQEGKILLNYELDPLSLVEELKLFSRRYSRLVRATELQKDGSEFPHVTNIGFINKYKSRQHLILLMALPSQCSDKLIDYLACQIESFLFFTNSLKIPAKNYETSFVKWAMKFREAKDQQYIANVVNETLVPYIQKISIEFSKIFTDINYGSYYPQYRERFVFGRLENTICRKCELPQLSIQTIQSMQLEHILPVTPKNLDELFGNKLEYDQSVRKLGNITLLEGMYNQSINNYNDMKSDWFSSKGKVYEKSKSILTNLLASNYTIGRNTALDRFKDKFDYSFHEWDSKSIIKRQSILYELALDTWLFNGIRLDNITVTELLTEEV